jgi:two-component system cell cycle sensor histidine kinase/response regulator CckA
MSRPGAIGRKMGILGIRGLRLKSRLRRYGALRYVFAVFLACLAAALHFGVQWLIGAEDDESAYEFFLGATALSAVWAGRLSGFVTLWTSALLKLYFFLPVFGSFHLEYPGGFVRFFVFLAIGSLICLGGGALYASREAFCCTLSSIGDAVVATDDKKSIRFINPVAESLSGWGGGTAVGRTIHDVLHVLDEKTLARMDLPIEAALRQGVVGHLAEGSVLVSKDGQKVPIQDSISPILGPSVHPRGAVMVFRDVTEQRRAENALRESESRYRFLVDSVPEFIYATDFRGHTDYFNQRWYDYTGLTVDQSMGLGWMAALHPDDVPQVVARATESVQGGTVYEAEYRLKSREGKYRWFLARGFPMRDDHGKVVRWFAICTDIDDFRRTQEQLHQALKMEAVGRLAGGVAHDFNNLLTVIMGYGRLLSDAAERSGAPSSEAKQILYAAERASELTRQLLTFSRRQIVQPRMMDLNSILRETETMIRRLIGEDIVVRTVLDPELLPVRIDRGQFEQVIVNLAVNARDAMPGGGQLTLETANVDLDDAYTLGHLTVEPGRYVMLAVSDTGQGMDQETQEHIFEPFFTTKEPEKGTGLGLSTVYGIVKQSGGHIWTYSEPGRGTTFKIYLPAVLAAGSEPRQLALPSLMQTRGTETILVLEDEPVVRQLVLAILAQQGYTVLEADTPEEALRLCKEYAGSIQLLVTDVVMPGMSGRQVAEAALTCRPTLKVLYMSGYTGDATAHLAVLDSGAAFLQKPFSSESLLQKVRELLNS